MALDPVELLQQLIQIPSVNPMGHDVRGPEFGEQRLTDFLQFQCEQLGLEWLRQRVHPGRDNLVVLIRGNPSLHDGGEFLLWDVHQDTVPVDGMIVDPFGGEVRDGRVYGRGAADVKGSLAAMLAGISRTLSDDRPRRTFPTTAISFTVNEECGFTGVAALVDLWRKSGESPVEIVGGTISPEQMFPRAPDAAIVAEPTGFDVVVAHEGVVRWRCHTIGRAAHTSRPDAGINAIYGMARIADAIEQFHADLQRNAPLHPLCGRPTVCVSTIRGGVAVNTVPELTTIEIDRRLGPDESPITAYDELVRYIASRTDGRECRIEHDPPFMQSGGLSDKHNHNLAEQLAAVTSGHALNSRLVGVPYATNASAIAATGVPTVVFGPGSIAQAHTADEFIAIDQLQTASDVFYQLASKGLFNSLSG